MAGNRRAIGGILIALSCSALSSWAAEKPAADNEERTAQGSAAEAESPRTPEMGAADAGVPPATPSPEAAPESRSSTAPVAEAPEPPSEAEPAGDGGGAEMPPSAPALSTSPASSPEVPGTLPSEPGESTDTGDPAGAETAPIDPLEVAPAQPQRPRPIVDIRPAGSGAAAQPVDVGSILQGTWTKSILFSTGNGLFRFQPRGWVQPRFNASIEIVKTRDGEHLLEDDRLVGTGFGLQRARFGFQAWLLEWGHVYLDTGWKSGSPQLVDYFVDVGPENGAGAVGVRVGFFRPYFVRQLLHATTQLAMIDYARAWTDASLDLGLGIGGRQLGAAVQGFALNGLEYGVGVWNGSDGYEADADFMYGGRIAVHPLGLAGVGLALRPGDESDAGVSGEPGLSIGAALYVENRDDATADVVPGDRSFEDTQLKVGFDVAFKVAGFSAVGELFLVKRWARERVLRDLLEDSDRAAPGMGGYLQLGYAVIRNRFEAVGRFDVVDENLAFRGVRFYPSVGGTFFIFGNNLKVQAQYRINSGAGYEERDPDHIYLSHDILLMLQAAI